MIFEKIPEVNEKEWEKEVLECEMPVIVFFWAAWCAPCRMMFDTLCSLYEKYLNKIKILRLNTDENPSIANRYKLMGIPTVVFINKGVRQDRLVGASSEEMITTKIERNFL